MRSALLSAPAAPASGAAPVPTVRQQLAHTQSALHDARQALYGLRGEYPRQPARFARIRAAILRHQAARAAYQAACEAFHASPEGAQLHRMRRQYACW
ncbi:hypothetical protein E5K00_14695 [Hymenobacter aquaticus]|uniref:CHAD domain-containing protein n=1 Tax=Hymenobacter aquaticus TaxID=1867101 RepID=A0A4Z0PUR6_9BACT|nr:hypothetical protein [Hymenobacter aquaticus]TGE21530.1 hypothetical protein E5K00_14695 [Hymenobacter aquaticus]